jgi:hypothetical protein
VTACGDDDDDDDEGTVHFGALLRVGVADSRDCLAGFSSRLRCCIFRISGADQSRRRRHRLDLRVGNLLFSIQFSPIYESAFLFERFPGVARLFFW